MPTLEKVLQEAADLLKHRSSPTSPETAEVLGALIAEKQRLEEAGNTRSDYYKQICIALEEIKRGEG